MRRWCRMCGACVIKGKATYELTEHEKSSLKYRRSLVAVKPIAEGEAFTEENVRSIRPAIGIKPKYYRTLLGRKAKKAYRFGEPILRVRWSRQMIVFRWMRTSRWQPDI